jgi:hypothetical protein
MWSRGAGVVARGPKMLLRYVPTDRAEVQLHASTRDIGSPPWWRLEVSGRFLASDGVVYPSGVPFPEELHDQTAVIANEVWLYTDGDGDVLGVYWWPDAVRRPIASIPRDDFPEGMCFHPLDAARHVDVPVPMPDRPPWEAAVAVCIDSDEVLVFCTPSDTVVEPLNEMVVYENGGLSVRVKGGTSKPDLNVFLRAHQPPYRRVQVNGCAGIGRDPGRSLGPQTWPWPGEIRWWTDGLTYEVKGLEQIGTLVEVAATL